MKAGKKPQEGLFSLHLHGIHVSIATHNWIFFSLRCIQAEAHHDVFTDQLKVKEKISANNQRPEFCKNVCAKFVKIEKRWLIA